MKVLVTGASGFVGGHVCRTLSSSGHEVTAAVRRSGSAPAGTREVVVETLDANTDWSSALAAQDAVVHLAARVHVMNETAQDPWRAFAAVNLDGTENLARQAAGSGVGRFVFMSSIKANGEQTDGEAFTSADVDAPSDPYGLSKFLAEQKLRDIEADSSMSVLILRSPLVYGAGVGGNVLRLMKAIARGVPLPFGAVHNRRSMIFVENLAAVVDRAVVAPTVAEPLLCSDNESVSTADLIRELASGMGIKARLFWAPVSLMRAAGRVTGRSADIDRLVGSLEVANNLSLLDGYQERVPAREAIRLTGKLYEARR
jgi:nucleoside-diphosphate-sugar epimerase